MLKTIVNGDYYRVFSNRNADGTYTIGMTSKPFPKEIGVIVGDAVHSLRTSLDHVTTQIIKEATGTNKRISFPVHETRKNLHDAVGKSPVTEHFSAFDDLVMNVIKPHRDLDGDHILWAVSKLNNIDKHNELILTADIIGVTIERMVDERDNVCLNSYMGVKAGGTTGAYKLAGKIQIDGDIHPSIEVLLGPEAFLEGKHLLPTLVDMANRTLNAINAIEAEYLR